MDFLTDHIFYILSKLAWILLSPTNLLAILVILATLLLLFGLRKFATKILVITSLLLFTIMAYPVGDYAIEPLENRFAKPAHLPKKIDGIIVLGGAEDIVRSKSWHTKEVGASAERFLVAADLAKHYPKAPVIFTGGIGQLSLQEELSSTSTEKPLPIGRIILQDLGIKADRLIVESDSRNTYENFKNIKAILPITPPEKGEYLLVTSAYHMPRSVGIARKHGIQVIAYPVDHRSTAPKYRRWDFKLLDHLDVLEKATKEWVGLTAYYYSKKTSSWLPKPLSIESQSHQKLAHSSETP